MSRRRWPAPGFVRAWVAVLPFALAASGCAGWKRGAAEPRVRVERLETSFGEDGHGQLDLDVRVDNRDGLAGEVTGLRCDVYFDQRWFAASEGLLKQPLPAHGRIPLTLHVPWALRHAGGAPAAAQELDVEVRGDLEVTRASVPERWEFTFRQRLRVAGAPAREPPDAL